MAGNPGFVEFSVEGGPADFEAAGDLGHLSAVMRDGEADDLVLHILQRADVAGWGQHGEGSRQGQRYNRYFTTRYHRGCRDRLQHQWCGRNLHVDMRLRGEQGEIVKAKLVALAHHDRAIDRVFELADVAGPVELGEVRDRLAADAADDSVLLGGKPRQEMPEQMRDVLA